VAERRPVFRQRDIDRAIAAAKAAGLEVIGVRVDKDGFEIKTAPPGQSRQAGANEWDEDYS
jgi:hypothetical protein